MKIMRWLTALTILACCGVLSYAQADGGFGTHGPGGSQPLNSLSQSLNVISCSTVPTPTDCTAYDMATGLTAQGIVAFYDQTGFAINNATITLDFPSADGGQTVGCNSMTLGAMFGYASCEAGSGVPIPMGGGDVPITINETMSGTGISCYNSGTNMDDPVSASANNLCKLTSSIFGPIDQATGNALGLPFINVANPTNVQASGPCTVPTGFTSVVLGSLVCGPNSIVIGLGITGTCDGVPCSGSGYGTFPALPTAAGVEVFVTPEPQTLLLVGAALLGMSMLFMKKKAIIA